MNDNFYEEHDVMPPQMDMHGTSSREVVVVAILGIVTVIGLTACVIVSFVAA